MFIQKAWRTAAFGLYGFTQFTKSGFLEHAKKFREEDMQIRLDGKNCLVTGANSGIGFATAEGLASHGATVYMLCRNKDRGEAALNQIRSKTGNANVHLEICDLSSINEVKSFATKFTSMDKPLHVLVNNAGLLEHKRETTAEGLELNFAVNVAATYTLTELVMPILEKAAPDARVITVASGGMYTEPLNKDLQKCKDPVKIPKERVYEMGGSCFLVTFTAEGFEQIDDLPSDNDGKGDEGKGDDGKGDEDEGNGNIDKGDDIDPDEDDLLGDDSEEDFNQARGNTKRDGGSKHKEQSTSKKSYQSSTSSPKNDGVRDKSVRRPLTFLEDFHELSLENASGFELLKAMELEGSDEEDTECLDEQIDHRVDEDSYSLPIEWVDHLTVAKESPRKEKKMDIPTVQVATKLADNVGDVEEQYSQPTNEDLEKVYVQLNSYANPKKAKKQVWGPILAQKRSKRVPDDGKTMMERAQEIKMNQDLEIPQEIQLEEYGCTHFPGSCGGGEVEDLVPGGEGGGHFPKSENVQRQGEPSSVDAMEMKDGEFWCGSGGLPQDVFG